MAKFIKMYITTEDVSKRLSEPYTGKEVAFTTECSFPEVTDKARYTEI